MNGATDPNGGSFWLPPQTSTAATDVDFLFRFILGVSAFFFVLIAVLLVVFLIRYRRRPGDGARPADGAPAEGHSAHGMILELTWSGIPLVLVIAIFYLGMTTYLDMRVAPKDAYEIQVTAQKWSWLFTYPSGYTDGDLHVPLDVPVRLVMRSEDVIHSLFIPNFRVKQDIVPGRYADLWFQAKEPGEYPLVCTEYCGTKHSDMSARVVVHEDGEFEPWLARASSIVGRLPPAEAGAELYKMQGCKQCHTTTGEPLVGPTFKGLYGRERPVEGGGSVLADENYIRESVMEPQKRLAKGFGPVMPPYKGRLSDREITALIEFVKTLK